MHFSLVFLKTRPETVSKQVCNKTREQTKKDEFIYYIFNSTVDFSISLNKLWGGDIQAQKHTALNFNHNL